MSQQIRKEAIAHPERFTDQTLTQAFVKKAIDGVLENMKLSIISNGQPAFGQGCSILHTNIPVTKNTEH